MSTLIPCSNPSPCKCRSPFFSSNHGSLIMHQCLMLANQGSSPPCNITSKLMHAKYKSHMVMRASGNSQPEPQVPAGPSSPAWKNWMVGILVSIVLPAFGHKWGPLLVFKNKLNAAVEAVETVTEAVEGLAEQIEKAADEVESKLPDDTKLKDAMESVKNLAKETAKEAEFAQELVHKVEDVERDIEKMLMDGDMDQPKVGTPKESKDVDAPVKK